MRTSEEDDYNFPRLDFWEFQVDNDFATRAMKHMKYSSSLQQKKPASRLCGRCSSLDFWSPGFWFQDVPASLKDSAQDCDFCRLRLHACARAFSHQPDRVRFERYQSTIILDGQSFPVLSIFRSPEFITPLEIQIGEPQSFSFANLFEIAKEWLKDCDDSHLECQARTLRSPPTRLIHVGTHRSPEIRLVESKEGLGKDLRYLALSHPWGDVQQYSPFVSRRYNVEKFRTSIMYDDLPQTFQHAVDCARNLDIPYLWIDAICVIFGEDGDFRDEAKLMGDVFSGAYCVIAACWAENQLSGFLNVRPPREYVTFQPDRPFYVCETIDHFHEDVILGPLHQRGWVLQERALARRTIYFTSRQTYFECGNGIRCETLTKMRNTLSDFLGDPNFPQKAMENTRGAKIVFIQSLFKRYSRMAFTRWQDRPIAIAGLENRLHNAFGTRGQYGIFDDRGTGSVGLFYRSLLWQRDLESTDELTDDELQVIEFPDDIIVPSWSWMAYAGAIDYLSPPFDSVNWEPEAVTSPWVHEDPGAFIGPDPALTAIAHNFNVAGRRQGEVNLIYDHASNLGGDGRRPKCVLVARSKEDHFMIGQRMTYVLLVAHTGGITADGWPIYKRVGVGSMLERFIKLEDSGTTVMVY